MRRLYWTTLFVLSTFVCRAQTEVAFSNYWALQSFYNPAATGMDGLLNVQGAYSMQMAGFDDAPSVMYVGADMPVFFLGPRHGMGLSFLNDVTGIFSSKKMAIQYAYHQPLFKGNLSIGVRGALLSHGVDGGSADTEDSSDPAIPTNEVKGTGFDLDLGLHYRYKKRWYAGISMIHVLNPTILLGDEKTYEIQMPSTFYVMGGYSHPLKNPRFTLRTDAAFRTDWMDWRADLTARVHYEGHKHKMYGGMSYSPTKSVSYLLGIHFHGVQVGYAYEMYTGGIGALYGTHELTLSYQTDLNLFKKGKNKHKCVRLL